MSPDPDKLEQFIDRALRDLPPRQAPRSLVERVAAELERQAALPWWRKSFAHWPLGARVGFFLLGGAMVRLVWAAGLWVMAGFDATALGPVLQEPATWLEHGLTVLRALSDPVVIVVRNIPSLWLHAVLVLLASGYAAIFGLGAVAFKALRDGR